MQFGKLVIVSSVFKANKIKFNINPSRNTVSLKEPDNTNLQGSKTILR